MTEQTSRLQHTVNLADSTTPTVKAKLAGVRGCKVWVKIGTAPPASVSDLQYHAADTRTPTSRGSTKPTPAKPPTTGSAGKHQRRNRSLVGRRLGNNYGIA